MKLKKVEEVKETKEVKKPGKSEENIKRGKRARRKGSNYELVIAKKLGARYGAELKRTPQSGGFAKKTERADDYRGDITIVDTRNMLLLHLECKDQKTWALPAWLKQAEEDCPEGRVPVIVMHKYNTSKDYVVLPLEDFMNMVPRDKVIGRREFK